MRMLILVAAVVAAAAAVARFRGREPRYAYGRWREDAFPMPTVVPIMDGP